ncbi:MAG: hypothetical protein C0412_04610 [Flavobacterium sp.]|nr:hypothetical protein [Flavobacterium sp.]
MLVFYGLIKQETGMKKSLILIVFIFITLTGCKDNFKPINPTDKGNILLGEWSTDSQDVPISPDGKGTTTYVFYNDKTGRLVYEAKKLKRPTLNEYTWQVKGDTLTISEKNPAFVYSLIFKVEGKKLFLGALAHGGKLTFELNKD